MELAVHQQQLELMEGCVVVVVVVVVAGVDLMVAHGAGISGKHSRMSRCVSAS